MTAEVVYILIGVLVGVFVCYLVLVRTIAAVLRPQAQNGRIIETLPWLMRFVRGLLIRAARSLQDTHDLLQGEGGNYIDDDDNEEDD